MAEIAKVSVPEQSVMPKRCVRLWRGFGLGRASAWAWALSGLLACDDDPTVQVDGGGNGSSNGNGNSGGSGNIPPPPATGGTGSTLPPAPREAPALRGSVRANDATVARQALELLGSSAVGSSGSCSTCHSLGRPTLTRWRELTSNFVDACLRSTSLGSQNAVDTEYRCFNQHAQRAGGLSPGDFGVYAAALHLDWFRYVFENASESAGPSEVQSVVDRVGMPRAGVRWTQAQFDVVAEWFARGVPQLLELVPEDSGQPCVPRITTTLQAHVRELAQSGWRARNAQVPLLMYGCDADQAGADCLAEAPSAASQYQVNWDVRPGTTIRVLYDNSENHTAYWTRSSADGRYIASGLTNPDAFGASGQIVDLARNAVVHGNFSFDAMFFPDNSAFLVQQRPKFVNETDVAGPSDGAAVAGDVAITCEQSVLSSAPEELTGEEPECQSFEGQIGLYEQLAKSVDGEDYWVVFGSFESDDASFQAVTQNPPAAFESQSMTRFVPMVNRGNGFQAQSAIAVATPQQGDPMLSPSGRLLLTRVKGPETTENINGQLYSSAEQAGYALQKVSLRQSGGQWTAGLEEVGRVCLSGGKPAVSFDERWMVLHHYVTAADATELGFSGAEDPDFSDYAERGASNLYLVDLLTGQSSRITAMEPGQYALYPHFRSDGWIYFVVRTLDGNEVFVASDAALISERTAQSP
jgi:hypothetical protein